MTFSIISTSHEYCIYKSLDALEVRSPPNSHQVNQDSKRSMQGRLSKYSGTKRNKVGSWFLSLTGTSMKNTFTVFAVIWEWHRHIQIGVRIWKFSVGFPRLSYSDIAIILSRFNLFQKDVNSLIGRHTIQFYSLKPYYSK